MARPQHWVYRLRYGWMIPGILLSACQPTMAPMSSQIPSLDPAENGALNTTSIEVIQAERPAGAPLLLSTLATTQISKDAILPAVQPLEVQGDLVLAGSNAMAPLVQVITERFIDEGFAGSAEFNQIGSAAGFDIFCQEGSSDIALASRAISEAEQQACNAIGRQPVALQVGTDALAIVVGQGNDFVDSVTLAELKQIFTAEYWSEVRPEWPRELIQRTIPESGSGATRLFASAVFDNNPEPLLTAPNTEIFSEDEDYLVQTLAVNPYAIAFFSYAYYTSNQDTLSIIQIDGVGPTNREAYPLVRPLFLYTDATLLSQKPEVGTFLNFFLTHVDEEIRPLGYASLPRDTLNNTKQTLVTLLRGNTPIDNSE
ncbi:MAG: substrate-binding domain-containing protein [Cyanobacteria bacterium J06638_28]